MSNFLVVTLLLQMSYVGKMQFFFFNVKAVGTYSNYCTLKD